MTNKSLENELNELIYLKVEDDCFNDTYVGLVHLMKKVVEDESYRAQLMDIGKNIDYGPKEGDSLEVYLKKIRKVRELQFGLENTLKHVLWDGQMSEEDFEETFNKVVDMMKRVVENKDYASQLYKINLDNYKNEEE